jgi:uncharacterized protein YdiU (UPF0061 family)
MVQRKNEESDLLKNIEVQEIQENLQELLKTLKELGKEVSEDIQEQVKVAEERMERYKKIISELEKDLSKTTALHEKVEEEKTHLEEKLRVINIPKKNRPKIFPALEKDLLEESPQSAFTMREAIRKNEKFLGKNSLSGDTRAVGFSPGLVRKIYRLADESCELNDIVRKTNLTPAEVQLILNLRDNRFSTPN